MNREFKFRAWDNVNIEMLFFEGFNWHDEYDLCYLGGKLNVPAGDNLNWMQYTGLKDKESNDIYEGDLYVVAEPSGDGIGVYQVMFVNGAFVGGKSNSSCQPVGWDEEMLDHPDRWLKVIGNIHQHPHLLNQIV
jgi:uncharacterized phage protein (TIGR01671 family)